MAPASKLPTSIMAAIMLASSAHAEAPATWSDFFATIGGSADIDIVGTSSVVARPLREHRAEVADVRFFNEKKAREPDVYADRGLAAFRSSCEARGGALVESDNDRTRTFIDRVSGHLTRPTGHKHQWRAKGAICEDREGVPLAGYLALLQDNSAVAEQGDAGSRLIGNLFGMRTPTAIYLFRPDRLQSRVAASASAQAAEDRTAIMETQMAAERAQIEAFQSKLAIGDETNCGAVIAIRGPMAEIAVPANVRAPNGAATFWTRIERLVPQGFGLCSYGL